MGKIKAFVVHVLAFFKPQPQKFEPIEVGNDKFSLTDYMHFAQLAPITIAAILAAEEMPTDKDVQNTLNRIMGTLKKVPVIYNEIIRLTDIERQARKNFKLKQKADAEYKEPTETLDDLNSTSAQMNEVIAKMMKK